MDEEIFVFGSFRLILAQRMLSADGKPRRGGSRALDILVALIDRVHRKTSVRTRSARWRTDRRHQRARSRSKREARIASISHQSSFFDGNSIYMFTRRSAAEAACAHIRTIGESLKLANRQIRAAHRRRSPRFPKCRLTCVARPSRPTAQG
jgi:hypothetical protein